MKKIITGISILLALISFSVLGYDEPGIESQGKVYSINIFATACVLGFSGLALLMRRRG